jgi:hypothetical protein
MTTVQMGKFMDERRVLARLRERKSKLLRGQLFAGLAAELPRDALLQDLQHEGRSALGWLADEQVNVIGS